MKKIVRKIHLWLSLPAGIIISIICFTGAILVFKDEMLAYMGYESIRNSPLMWVMKLHRWFMDDTRTWGKMLVGISTLFFIAILITGIISFWPKRWKKKHFIIGSGKSLRQRLYNLHTVLGLYASVILLVCAFTGLMWSFQWYREMVGFIFNTEVQRGAPIWKLVHSIHFGNYGGWFSKIPTFIAAIIGGCLPITGYWMYFSKLNKRKKSAQVKKRTHAKKR